MSSLKEERPTRSYLISDFDPKGGAAGRYFRSGATLPNVPFRASGSRQLDKPRLRSTLEEIAKEVAHDGRIFLVDLREESHLFFDDRAVSWYADKNHANAGRPLSWIHTDELARIERIEKTRAARLFSIAKDDEHRVTPTGSTEITVGSAETEAQFAGGLVVGRTVEYVRLPVTDHCIPRADTFARFIDLIRRIACESDWVHFHCRGGSGRTTMFLAMYDMVSWVRSAASELPALEEFARRQSQLFPYCLNPDGCSGNDATPLRDDWKHDLRLARWRFLAAWRDSVRYRTRQSTGPNY